LKHPDNTSHFAIVSLMEIVNADDAASRRREVWRHQRDALVEPDRQPQRLDWLDPQDEIANRNRTADEA
jgi:hypothetical protein